MEDHSVLGYLRRQPTYLLEITLEHYLCEPEQYCDAIDNILQILEERHREEQKTGR